MLSSLRLLMIILVACSSMVAQDTRPASRSGPVDSGSPKSPKLDGASSNDVLIEALTSGDFETRENATELLRRRGEDAREAMTKALADATHAEQRLRLRGLLSELGATSDSKGRRRDFEDNGELRLLEEDDVTDPRRRSPSIPKAGRPHPRIEDFDSAEEYLRAVKAWMNELFSSQNGLGFGAGRDRMDFFGPFEGPSLRFHFGPGLDGNDMNFQSSTTIVQGDERLTMVRTPEKIVLEVAPAGSEKGTSFEAKDLEDFKTKHPEVYRKYESSGVFEAAPGFSIRRFGLTDGTTPGARRDPFGQVFPPMNSRKPTERPTLGIEIGSSVNDRGAGSDSRPSSGLEIVAVERDSAAALAGLAVGDRIESVDGKAIRSFADVREVMDRAAFGDVLRFTVQRGTDLVKVDVRLHERKKL